VIAGVTGHRPDKLGVGRWSGYDRTNPLRVWIREQMKVHLKALQPEYAISGMAIGVDQDFVDVCIKLAIPFVAAVPFVGQERQWPALARAEYTLMLALAKEVVVVCEGGYERWKMQARNEWVVDRSNVLIAVFDGSQGGTANTVNYADRVGREKRRIEIGPMFKGAPANCELPVNWERYR
jgi:uncharacterized phage-like protein YoqJ